MRQEGAVAGAWTLGEGREGGALLERLRGEGLLEPTTSSAALVELPL